MLFSYMLLTCYSVICFLPAIQSYESTFPVFCCSKHPSTPLSPFHDGDDSRLPLEKGRQMAHHRQEEEEKDDHTKRSWLYKPFQHFVADRTCGLFSSDNYNDDEEEPEALDSSSRSDTPLPPNREHKLKQRKEKPPVWWVAARVSAFEGMMGWKVEGKVWESVAVVKKSEDPYHDFKRSMMEMIVEKMFEQKENAAENNLYSFSLSRCSPVIHHDSQSLTRKLLIKLFCSASENPDTAESAKLKFSKLAGWKNL
ncbi:hypothetical protein K1719_028297 [Acacia pycnantha]|nr:hypothetical protein K1719_028297 [Acacia pycnantha]